MRYSKSISSHFRPPEYTDTCKTFHILHLLYAPTFQKIPRVGLIIDSLARCVSPRCISEFVFGEISYLGTASREGIFENLLSKMQLEVLYEHTFRTKCKAAFSGLKYLAVFSLCEHLNTGRVFCIPHFFFFFLKGN